jgi:hypothetical protein
MVVATSILVLTLVSTVLAFFCLTFLFKGWNPFFATSEHIYIAGTTAVGIWTTMQSLYSSAFVPILNGTNILLILPVLAGLLTFTRYTRYRWLARYPVAMLSGIGLGIIVGQTLRPQILNAADLTLTNIASSFFGGTSGIAGSVTSGAYSGGGVAWGQWWEQFSSIFMLAGVLVVLSYFLYSVRFSTTFHEGRLRWMARLGRLLLMLTFGYLWAKIFLDEAIDMGSLYWVLWIRRPVQQILSLFGIII